MITSEAKMNDDNSDKSFTRAFTINDFTRICRICLIDLNLDNVDNMAIDDARDLLDYSVQMKIECPDRLPQNVCVSCIRELQRSCEFKRLIFNNDVILKKLLHEVDEPSLTDDKDGIVIDLHYLVDDEKSTLKETAASYFTDENSSENKDNHQNVDLRRNITVHIYSCSHCGNGFTGRDRLTQHEKTHANTEDIDENVKAGESGKSEKFTSNIICGSNFQTATTHVNKRHAQEPPPVNESHHHDAVSCEERNHICQICSESYESDVLLKDHQAIHKTKNHACPNCGKGFGTQQALKRHSRTHTGEKPFSCKVCKRSFRHSSALVGHSRVHSGDRPYKCKICSKAFKTSSDLSQHTKIHTGEKPYECNDCGARFSRSHRLKVHLRKHTGETPFNCTVCKRSFRESADLVRHLRVHSGERPFKCKICLKAFKASGALSKHTKIHTGEKPYECNDCGKRFLRKQSLELHLRTHTKENLFSCTVCERSVKYSLNFARHLRMHSGERPYKCKICPKAFERSIELTVHTKIHESHEKPYECSAIAAKGSAAKSH